MSFTHMHLLLNHLPVVGTLMVTVLLAFALAKRSSELTKASLAGLVGLALIAIVVYFTGEPAEEAIENLPGFSEAITERHEEFAAVATIALGIVGSVALGVLLIVRRRQVSRGMIAVSFLLSMVATGMMGYTALLGGQVRHTEVRSGFVTPAEAHDD